MRVYSALAALATSTTTRGSHRYDSPPLGFLKAHCPNPSAAWQDNGSISHRLIKPHQPKTYRKQQTSNPNTTDTQTPRITGGMETTRLRKGDYSIFIHPGKVQATHPTTQVDTSNAHSSFTALQGVCGAPLTNVRRVLADAGRVYQAPKYSFCQVTWTSSHDFAMACPFCPLRVHPRHNDLCRGDIIQ